MKYIRPFYYDEFKCIGGECEDNCCAGGWDIFVEEEIVQAYQQVEGEFGEKLNRAIITGDVNKIKLDEKKCCPLLNRELLCEVYINLGEDKMGKVCKQYPRMYRKYRDVVECDLSLSCPEVARVLVKYNQQVEFLLDEYLDENDMVGEIDKINFFNALIAARGLSVDIMQMEDIPFWKRLYICINISDKIQQQIDNDEINKIKNIIGAFQCEEYIKDILKSLDEVRVNTSLKLAQYIGIINNIMKLKLSNQKFVAFLIETANFISNHAGNKFEEEFYKISEEFDIFYKDNKAFENYIVYYLFHYYMVAYDEGNIHKYIVVMIEAYSIMKLFALVRWFNNGFQLSDEDLIDILYSYSREIEHGNNTMSELFNHIKENGFDKTAYLIALIR